MATLLPAGFRFRLRASQDASRFAESLDLQTSCKEREITLLEPAELGRPRAGVASPEVKAVLTEWDKLLARQAADFGMTELPQRMLPLKRAMSRLKAAA